MSGPLPQVTKDPLPSVTRRSAPGAWSAPWRRCVLAARPSVTAPSWRVWALRLPRGTEPLKSRVCLSTCSYLASGPCFPACCDVAPSEPCLRGGHGETGACPGQRRQSKFLKPKWLSETAGRALPRAGVQQASAPGGWADARLWLGLGCVIPSSQYPGGEWPLPLLPRQGPRLRCDDRTAPGE